MKGKTSGAMRQQSIAKLIPPDDKLLAKQNKLIYQLFAQCSSLQGPHRRGEGKDAVKRSGCVNPAKYDFFNDFISEVPCWKNERCDAVAEHSEVNPSLSA